jgi:phosphoribosylglycinamide formyltransferase-1
MRIAILASTNGTDMDALLGPHAAFEVALVVANKECGALERARRAGAHAALIPSQGVGREAYDGRLTAALEERAIDLVVLIGFMRLLTPAFVARWQGRIMNIHPSLLPAFAGGMDTSVHAAVLERGCKVTGCTLHFVDEGADTGPIIMQRAVPVLEGDTQESLKERVQSAERQVLREAVEKYAQGKIRIERGKVIVA